MICEGCIKQDVCKYKSKVERYEIKEKLPEPLEPIIGCKYKQTESQSYWDYTGITQGIPCGTISGMVTDDPWVSHTTSN